MPLEVNQKMMINPFFLKRFDIVRGGLKIENIDIFNGASAFIKTLALLFIKCIQIGLFINFLPIIIIFYIIKTIIGSD